MRRGSLAYPLQRGADADQGGAAELQTDVMRFMAILSLCLVAIFALVQSLPVAPAPASTAAAEVAAERVRPAPVAAPLAPPPIPPAENTAERSPAPVVTSAKPATAAKSVTPAREPDAPLAASSADAVLLANESATPSPGFTLRFASDAALMQTVAARRVGFYAIGNDRALRMTVSESRISFWDASVPGTIHEMEPSTVPPAVSEALQRAGVDAAAVTWGVTLPGQLKSKLDQLLQAHDDGALVITADGSIHREAP